MAGVTGVICYFKHVDINFGVKVKILRGFFYMAGVTGVISYFEHVDINSGVKVKICRGVFLSGWGNRGNQLL